MDLSHSTNHYIMSTNEKYFFSSFFPHFSDRINYFLQISYQCFLNNWILDRFIGSISQ